MKVRVMEVLLRVLLSVVDEDIPGRLHQSLRPDMHFP